MKLLCTSTCFTKFFVKTLHALANRMGAFKCSYSRIYCKRNTAAQLVHVMSTSDYLHLMHAYCELFTHKLLKQERTSMQKSHGICIYDMQGVTLGMLLNPWNVINRFYKARVHMWQQFYDQLLGKVIIVNAPGLLTSVWPLVKRLVNERHHTKFVMVSKIDEIKQHVDPDALPPAYGGNLVFDTSEIDASGCSRGHVIKECDYKDTTKIWKDSKASPSEKHRITVKSNATECVNVKVEKGEKLIYEWTSDAEIEFVIHTKSTGE